MSGTVGPITPQEFLDSLGVSYTEPAPGKVVPRSELERFPVLNGPLHGRRVSAPNTLEVFEIGRLTGYYKRKGDHFEYRSIVNAPQNEQACPFSKPPVVPKKAGKKKRARASEATP